MRRRLSLALALALLGVFSARAEDDSDDRDANGLVSSMPSVEEAEEMFVAFAALRRQHGSPKALFDHYNRFQDASKETGEQGLGNQEMRQLLKDVGLGNLIVRGELANLAIKLTDSSADGRVSERELDATCERPRWHGGTERV